jgi:hypothetical protein
MKRWIPLAISLKLVMVVLLVANLKYVHTVKASNIDSGIYVRQCRRKYLKYRSSFAI